MTTSLLYTFAALNTPGVPDAKLAKLNVKVCQPAIVVVASVSRVSLVSVDVAVSSFKRTGILAAGA